MAQLERPFSAERASAQAVREQARTVLSIPELATVLNAVPSVLLILNPQRQVIFANRGCLELLGLSSAEELYGKRPGEILECDHACESPGGCGTSESCRSCGAAQAIFACERGTSSVQECRIRRRNGSALDMRISTTPFHYRGEHWTVLAASDISHEKRRQALERVFFHDLLNTAGSIMGYSELLRFSHPGEVQSISSSLVRLTESLAEEIRAQRDLVLAETDDLRVAWEPLNARALLLEVVEICSQHSVAQGRVIQVREDIADAFLTSDGRLIRRVIGNMIKNALEASEPGQTVEIGCTLKDRRLTFSVRNPACIPREIQTQVFQRSFSTKGGGRGLGTYSMKLLGERYLHGKVWFTSSPHDGTTFNASFPQAPPPQ